MNTMVAGPDPVDDEWMASPSTVAADNGAEAATATTSAKSAFLMAV